MKALFLKFFKISSCSALCFFNEFRSRAVLDYLEKILISATGSHSHESRQEVFAPGHLNLVLFRSPE